MITRYIVEIETARIGDEFSADWVQDVIKANLENDTTQKVNVNLLKMPSEEEIKTKAEEIASENGCEVLTTDRRYQCSDDECRASALDMAGYLLSKIIK